MLDFDDLTTPRQFIDSFNLCNSIENNRSEVVASPIEEKLLEEMFVQIKQFKDSSDIPYNFIQHVCVDNDSQLEKEYFPDDFKKDTYIQSFKSFCNEKIKTKDILKDVYMMSKCGQLIELTRKVLYRNDFEKFNLPFLEENIGLFIDYLKTFNYKKLRSNHVAQHGIFLKANIDLIADSTIYEIKASQYEYIKKEYILQILAYAALMKVTEQLDVKSIVFFNPFLGKITVFDISQWSYAKQFISFLVNKSNNNADQIIDDPDNLGEVAPPEQEMSYIKENENKPAFQTNLKKKKPEQPIFNVKEFKRPSQRVKQICLDESYSQKHNVSTSTAMDKSILKKPAKVEYPVIYAGKKSNESVLIEIEDNEENKINSDDDGDGESYEDFVVFASNISKKSKPSGGQDKNIVSNVPEDFEDQFLGEFDQNSGEEIQCEIQRDQLYEQEDELEEQKKQFIQIDD